MSRALPGERRARLMIKGAPGEDIHVFQSIKQPWYDGPRGKILLRQMAQGGCHDVGFAFRVAAKHGQQPETGAAGKHRFHRRE